MLLVLIYCLIMSETCLYPLHVYHHVPFCHRILPFIITGGPFVTLVALHVVHVGHGHVVHVVHVAHVVYMMQVAWKYNACTTC